MEEAWKLTERQKKEGRRYVEEGAEKKRPWRWVGSFWERDKNKREKEEKEKTESSSVCYLTMTEGNAPYGWAGTVERKKKQTSTTT